MNYPGGESEPPFKRQENGDASNGSERPHKKARFAWQVKGKYHLRNEASESKPGTSSGSSTLPQASAVTTNKPKDIVGNTEKNLERLGDYLLKQDFNTLDSVITDSEKSFIKPSTSISSHSLPYPRYTSSYETQNSCSSTSSQLSDVNNEANVAVPMSLVVTGSYHEDQCIARWQARQMAKGFVDNTINRVLDSWMVTPLPTEMDYRFVGFDVADFINNLPSNNSIENEGILMAISAHGLQNNSDSNADNMPSVESTKIKVLPKNVYPSPPSSPIQPDNDCYKDMPKKEFDLNSTENVISNDLEMSWSCSDDKIIDDNTMTPLSLFPETSSSSYPCFSDTEQKPNLDFEENNNSLSDDFASFDFMDAAVTFAIQNKGLTSFDTEYG